MNDRDILTFVANIQSKTGLPDVPRNLAAKDLLAQVINEMRRHEKLKYPNPPYECKTIKINDSSNKTLNVFYVNYNGEKLTNSQLSHMRAHALFIRKLSILAGILNAMKFSDQYLTPDPRQRLLIENLIKRTIDEATEKLSEQVNTPIQNLSATKEMNTFISQLTNGIQDITGNNDKKIIRDMRKAERYFVSDYNRSRVIAFETTVDGKSKIQLDIPFANTITDEQKQALITIHDPIPSQRPAWFNLLATWEKEWFLNIVPQTLADAASWTKFESLFQSSAMSHIPGIKNARTNFLLEKDDIGKYHIASRSFKMSTTLPYEMPIESRGEGVEQTTEQVVSHLAKEAKVKFQATWGNLGFQSELKPLVLCQGLLTDTIGGGNDNRLMAEQRDAIQRLRNQTKYRDVTILSANDPVNFFRYIAAEQGIFSKAAGRWTHIDSLLKYADAFRAQLRTNQSRLNPEQLQQQKLIEQAYEKLDYMYRHSNLPRFYRNFGAYKAAYAAILVEAMGGMVSTNCKSGKDRTGLDELYRSTMLMYFTKYGRLPSYNDNDTNHKKFMDLYELNFNSMKIQEAAAANTPGSFGIKDDAMMLCHSITKHIGNSYTFSNASINKPPAFMKDESAEAAELRSYNRRATKSKVYLPPIRVENPTEAQWHRLIKQREKILLIMQSLDDYTHDPRTGNKKSAAELYKVLDHINKRLRQAEAEEANPQTKFTAARLNALIANVEQSYNNAINEFTRNRVKRFVSNVMGKKVRYDAILENAQLGTPAPATPSLNKKTR